MSTATPTRPTAAAVPSRRHRAGLARHSGYLTARALRTLARQPAYVAMTIIQPVIWVLLFGQLFKSVIHVPGFTTASGTYLEFITPGVIVMTALFSSGWAGTVYIEDMNRGVMDRLLASPVRRGAMMIGTLAYQGLTTVLQTLIVFGIAYAAGARFPGAGAGSSSCYRCSSCPPRSWTPAWRPAWVRHVARYNPVDWAVVASRQALSAHAAWGAVWPRLGLLAALATAMAWLATRAFGNYQRSL